MSNFSDVGDFHTKFALPTSEDRFPGLLTDETFMFRYQFLQEELQELLKAHREGNLEDFADALVDLVYVALGTAHMAGVPWEELWAEVQRANMGKVRATESSQSKRGSSLDVVKPMGWRPPDVAQVLRDRERDLLRRMDRRVA